MTRSGRLRRNGICYSLIRTWSGRSATLSITRRLPCEGAALRSHRDPPDHLTAITYGPTLSEKYGEGGISLDKAMLIQLLGSAVSISLLVGLAAWAGLARPTPPLDAVGLAALLAQEFPDRNPTATWISADGLGALARDGAVVLVLWKRGDGYVAREIPWPALAAARSKPGRRVLKTGDAAPAFAVADNVWPPKELAA